MLQKTLSRIAMSLSEDLRAGRTVVIIPRQDAAILVDVLTHISALHERINDMHDFLHKIRTMPDRTTGLEPKIEHED